MHPSSRSGRRLRLALIPVSWSVAFAVVFLILEAVARIRSATIREIVPTGTMRPLLVIIPSLFFGKALGLMISNALAYVIPQMRRVFEQECRETGRPGYAAANKALSKVAAACLLLTLLGLWIFLALSP